MKGFAHEGPRPPDGRGFFSARLRIYLGLLAFLLWPLTLPAETVWPEVLDLPAYPGIRSPSTQGFPGLPNVLRFFDFEAGAPDGAPVEDLIDWWQYRRPEIMDMLRHYMYGREPPPPADLQFQVVSIETDAINGLATKKVIAGTHAPAGATPLRLVLYLPNGRDGPVPVVVALNGQGEHLIEPGGIRSNRWDLPETMTRGIAVVTAHCGGVFAQDGSSFRNHLIQPFADAGFSGNWKTISAWAWGLSRMMDYVVTDPDLDPHRVAVTGYSRRGKTALWAGALDDRFALVVPHQSGHGGSHSSRGQWGGTFSTQFPHWFLDGYTYLNGTEYNHLPFDQHFVIAMTAPRAVLLSENSSYGDNLNGMTGIRMSAQPVWTLFGLNPETAVQLVWDEDSRHQHLPRHWADLHDALLDLPHGGVEGFRLWAAAAGILSPDGNEQEALAAMRHRLAPGNIFALEAYWLGISPASPMETGLHINREVDGGILLTLPQRRDAVGLAGKGAHWRGIQQWLEVSDSVQGPWAPIPPAELEAVDLIDSGHPSAVRVRLRHPLPNQAGPRFYRVRYTLRFRDTPLLILQPPQDLTLKEGASAHFTVQLSGRDFTFVEWLFNGEPLPGEENTFLTLPAVTPADAGFYQFRAGNPGTEVLSAPALLNVIPNTTAAYVEDVVFLSPTAVRLRFSEPVAGGTGSGGSESTSHYSFSDGVSVQSAERLADERTVVLTVQGSELDASYTLTVAGIANQAVTPVFSYPQQLLLRQNAIAHINFQPTSLPVPSGWLADHGDLFGPRAQGLQYGWSAPPGTTRARNQDVSPDMQHDTLIHAGPAEFADDPDWSIALPNGVYQVRLVMGDAQYFDNQFDIRANGTLLVAGNANRDLRWLEGTREVEVKDGTLTLSKGPGARRNKLCFLEIRLP